MSQLLSPPGMIGALVGAAVGYVNFKIVTGIVAERLRALDRSASPAEKAAFEGKIALMRRLVFILTVPVVAAVGYWFGRSVGG